MIMFCAVQDRPAMITRLLFRQPAASLKVTLMRAAGIMQVRRPAIGTPRPAVRARAGPVRIRHLHAHGRRAHHNCPTATSPSGFSRRNASAWSTPARQDAQSCTNPRVVTCAGSPVMTHSA